jgi:Ala-tRNA(Pro) deacylase
MPGQLLNEYLERRKATYYRQAHNVAYTAPEIAQICHIQGHSFAKVVMIKVDDELAMMVLPAHHHVAVEVLAPVLGAEQVRLSTEHEFSYRFPRCEIGAMPPFGHLYGLQTYMVPVFEEGREIAFNAGSHSELIRMPLAEYLRLAYVNEISAGVLSPGMPLVKDTCHTPL